MEGIKFEVLPAVHQIFKLEESLRMINRSAEVADFSIRIKCRLKVSQKV